MKNFPPATQTNFFAAVDKWQIQFILSFLPNPRPPDPNQPGITVLTLPVAILQLLFGEPSIMKDPHLSTLINGGILSAPDEPQPLVTALGLTLGLLLLLFSPSSSARHWARTQLPACSDHPVTFEDWCDLDVGHKLLEEVLQPDFAAWEDMTCLIKRGAFSSETIRQGLLGGHIETATADKTIARGIMGVLRGRLGNDNAGTDYFSLLTDRIRVRASPRLLHIAPIGIPDVPYLVIRNFT